LAPVSIALAALARVVLGLVGVHGYPLIGFFVAALFTAWCTGLGPGLLALALGLVAALSFFFPSPGSFDYSELGHPVRMVAYGVFGVIGTLLVDSLRNARQRAADNLRQALDRQHQLEQEIAGRKKLEEALRETDRRKDEFLAMLAHELRNPLAPIRNGLHILKQASVDPSTREGLRVMMERQVVHLSRLVDDLLDVSRITQGKINLRKEVVDLTSLIRRAVAAIRPAVDARRHELTVSLPAEPVRLEADPTRLEQVLANLLHNAVKYTDPGGSIWLTARQEGKAAVINVRDTGLGIDPDLLPHIFDLFVQADRGLDRSQGGLGIGLTLVRRLVELHDGTVHAVSAGLAQGSEFIVRLPAMLPMRETGDNWIPPGSGSKTGPVHRILVVDDNRDAADSSALFLRLAGHEVRTVYDGPTALTEAQSWRPDVILLDLGLPGMDGYEIARRLRCQPDLQHVLLVALTGWGQEEDRRRSREVGIDQHLTKPVEPEALKMMLLQYRNSLVLEVPSPVPPGLSQNRSESGG
jgi:signal transduction histidine kinase/ActR/RegA family two-component response regulator